jgi:hypothetical protein
MPFDGRCGKITEKDMLFHKQYTGLPTSVGKPVLPETPGKWLD